MSRACICDACRGVLTGTQSANTPYESAETESGEDKQELLAVPAEGADHAALAVSMLKA